MCDGTWPVGLASAGAGRVGRVWEEGRVGERTESEFRIMRSSCEMIYMGVLLTQLRHRLPSDTLMTECVPFLTGFTAAALPAAFGDGAVAGVADKVGSAEGNG